ncbi:MAG: YcjF family protein [Myxococcaceae bacterium]
MGWMDSLNAATKKSAKPSERQEIAQDITMMSAFASAAVTYAPIPGADFVLVTPIQASMVMAIGRVYGRKLDFEESKHILMELASVCGVSLLAQKGFATASKLLLPVVGGIVAGVLSGPWAFAVTYGMGKVAMNYFSDHKGSRESMKRVFDDAVSEGKKLFSKEKLDEFRKSRGREVEDFAKEKAAPEKKAAPRKKTTVKKPAKAKKKGKSQSARA